MILKYRIKILILVLFCTIQIPNLLGQTPYATANFQTPDIEITTTPEFPGICNPDVGILVTCNENYESYSWELLNSPDPAILGNPVILTKTGTWELTIVANIDGRSCSRKREIIVRNLQDPNELMLYLREAGFYEIDVFRDRPTLIPQPEVCLLDKLSFVENDNKVRLDPVMTDVLNNFKPIAELGGTKMISNNSCICELGIEGFETQFNAGKAKLWVHQFFRTNTDTRGMLFIKARMPFEASLPIAPQKTHLASIHQSILAQNSTTSEEGRVIFSNLFMPHPIGGYAPFGVCNLPPNWNETHFLTPPKVAVQLPPDASSVHFADENTGVNIMEGVFIKFSSGGKIWHGYERNEIESIFNGYFNEFNATFYENFTASPALVACRGECNIEITTTNSGCDQSLCRFVTSEFTSDDFDITNVLDGGFDLVINPCSEIWKNSPISWEESKKFIFDLMCAIKTKQPSIEYETKFNGRIVFAKDVFLGDEHYPIVGLTMPNSGNSISLLLEVFLNPNDLELTYGFKKPFIISTNISVKLNFFENNHIGKACSDTDFEPSYTYNKWGQLYLSMAKCIKQCTDEKKNKFLEYVNPPNTENLLIFVNGYRPVTTYKQFMADGHELPTKQPKDALNLCNDNYENGNYWNTTGNSFVSTINNKNVLYVDGHHSISTSNHRSYAGFLLSATPCIQLGFLSNCIICNLNDTPYAPGFFIRYTQGKAVGEEILNKINQGKIKISKGSNGKITGKIDIVAHSFGYAVAKGVADYLKPYLSLDNKLGYFYIIAPENAEGSTGSTDPIFRLNTSNFDGVFQYGSDFNNEKSCHQDGIAPQIGINSNGLVPNVFIPKTEKYEPIRNFLDAHYSDNYGWIFTDFDAKQTITKRNP